MLEYRTLPAAYSGRWVVFADRFRLDFSFTGFPYTVTIDAPGVTRVRQHVGHVEQMTRGEDLIFWDYNGVRWTFGNVAKIWFFQPGENREPPIPLWLRKQLAGEIDDDIDFS